jgi:hypothetical protein
MAVKPWLTSDDIISSVKRKISFPTSQSTFTDEDILKFGNEEMMIALVPEVLSYHEEYFVYKTNVTLLPNTLRYNIPDRAIGMRLRDVFYLDESGNLFDMARINPDDKGYFQYNTASDTAPFRYYLEGNEIVLTPSDTVTFTPTGSLQVSYYLRPNQLVLNERAFTVNCFTKTIQCINANIVAGDTITLGDNVLTAVAGAPSGLEFQIGGTSEITATNLVNLINANLSLLQIEHVSNGSPSTNLVTLCYNNRNFEISVSNPTGFIYQEDTIGLQGEADSVPDNIEEDNIVDLLQTKPGHRILTFDIVPVTISTDAIVLNESDVPSKMVVGDYVCSQNECIIPYLPPDLHISLVERICARILSAIGDLQGLSAVTGKIQEIKESQSPLLGNRVDGDPKKILARKSLLRYSKYSYTKRY